jgi:hypothetical protein
MAQKTRKATVMTVAFFRGVLAVVWIRRKKVRIHSDEGADAHPRFQ